MTLWEILVGSLAFGAAWGIVQGAWNALRPHDAYITFSDPQEDRVIATMRWTNADDSWIRKQESKMIREGWNVALAQLHKRDTT